MLVIDTYQGEKLGKFTHMITKAEKSCDLLLTNQKLRRVSGAVQSKYKNLRFGQPGMSIQEPAVSVFHRQNKITLHLRRKKNASTPKGLPLPFYSIHIPDRMMHTHIGEGGLS